MDAHAQQLALTAMTLRGVGSYLYGQRLDLRPLTIICGENGSGKSTWFKAWNLLKNSRHRPDFPFAFAPDAASFWHDYTNSYLKSFPEYCEQDPAADSAFGPYGTIGLHFAAGDELILNPAPLAGADDLTPGDSVPHTFLLGGRCPKGTRFRLRLAHPVVNDPSDDYEPRPYDLVELQINDTHTIAFRKLHSDKRYSFTWSEGLLGDTHRSEPLAEYGADEGKVYPPSGQPHSGLGERLCLAAVLRVRELLEHLLGGIFYISAIRAIETRSEIRYASTEDEEAATTAIESRYVGPQGQWTWDLERAFAYNLMRQPPHLGTEPAAWNFTGDHLRDGYAVWDAIQSATRSPAKSPIKRIWELARAEAREAVGRVAETLDAVVSEEHSRWDDRDGWRRDLNEAKRRVTAAVAELVNELLDRRDLYESGTWPGIEGDAQTLAGRGTDQLTGAEVRRLNRRLVEAAFNVDRPRTVVVERVPCFRLEMYVSYWLRRLVETRILLETSESPSLGDHWTNDAAPPAGFLDDPAPNPGPESDVVRDGTQNGDAANLNRFLHVCFGQLGTSPYPCSPHFLSAGFHQVAPVVVQAGLLRRGEVMAVENPEVHLHPSLQLKLTEYLIGEARAGKVIVVETHSDLVVRRVLRAVLAEEFPQAQLAIYFAALGGRDGSGGTPYPYSTLDRLEVNDEGHVSNWPRGFMDDDVREARRLLDVMYGAEPEATEGGDGNEE